MLHEDVPILVHTKACPSLLKNGSDSVGACEATLTPADQAVKSLAQYATRNAGWIGTPACKASPPRYLTRGTRVRTAHSHSAPVKAAREFIQGSGVGTDTVAVLVPKSCGAVVPSTCTPDRRSAKVAFL